MSGFLQDPATILAFSLVVVVGAIVFLRVGAFLALISGALVVGFWSAATGCGLSVGQNGDWAAIVGFVATELGKTTGKIGILIVFGTIIGKCMTESGAAERIVQACRQFFGEKQIPAALAGGAFVLSIPVFYDATFYLLLPLAKSVYRNVRKNYPLYLLSVGLGGTISHTVIPPTPGPIAVAETLGVSLATSLGIGLLVGACLFPVAIFLAWGLNKLTPKPTVDRAVLDEMGFDANESNKINSNWQNSANDEKNKIGKFCAVDANSEVARNASGVLAFGANSTPPLWLALAPILLPVFLIATASIVGALRHNPAFGANVAPEVWSAIALLGDSNVALGLAALLAGGTLVFSRRRRTSFSATEKLLNAAISSAGTIVLITAAGGAYGATLRASGIGERIQELFVSTGGISGGVALTSAFLATALLKTAQGSSTTAMITSASIFASMNLTNDALGFNLGYLAAAIGVGSSVASWMNDSGFCLFSRSSGLAEVDCLKTWTAGTAAIGVAGFGVVFALSRVLPFV